MTIQRFCRQVTTTKDAIFKVWDNSNFRRAAALHVVGAGALVYIDGTENVNILTSFLLPIGVIIPFGKGYWDSTSPIWAVDGTGSISLFIYEEFTRDKYDITGKDG